MKTLDLSMAALIVGALGASFAACSAQSSSGPPRTNTGTGGSGTGTGATGTGATGATGTGATGAGATGATGTGATGATGTGATGATGTGATGGTVGTGTGGTVGTGTGGTVGAGTGGATGAMSCGTLQVSAADPKCCVATGAATELAIDSLEDGDNTILPIGNRQGYWYTYNDKTGNPASTTTQMPLPGGTFAPTAGGHACSLLPVPGACAGPTGGVLWSAETSGSVAPVAAPVYPFAGMGFDFNNHFMKSCVYGGSAYKGISFWAKSVATQFLFEVKTQATTTMDALGEGSCTTLCNDNYAKAITPTAAWSQFTVMFNDPLFAQQKFGTPVAFDANTLIGVQFQVPGAATALPYDFAIDDVAFVP